MNLFQLLEAVKSANTDTREELLDRYYRREKVIVDAMTSHEERRKHDIER